jgi:transposase
MPKALSFDLRSRVLAAIDEGLSCRQAATRFGVSASSAIRWQGMRRAGGDARPKPQGGDRLSRRTEAHAELIHAALAEVPDITLPELKARLAEKGAQVSVSALWRFCRRHKITRKKPRSAKLAGRPEVREPPGKHPGCGGSGCAGSGPAGGDRDAGGVRSIARG